MADGKAPVLIPADFGDVFFVRELPGDCRGTDLEDLGDAAPGCPRNLALPLCVYVCGCMCVCVCVCVCVGTLAMHMDAGG
jgi:hypothetical protein